MPKKKTPKKFFLHTHENNSDINREIINSTEIKKLLQLKIKKNYAQILNL